jgi:DNA-binding transcriptional regulator YbjK
LRYRLSVGDGEEQQFMSMTAIHGDPEVDSLPLRERVVQEAIRQAEATGWEAVRLTEVAARLDLPMAEVLEEFRDLDAVADAWFLRGWQVMLAEKPEGFARWSERERLAHSLLAWFGAFSGHRGVTVEMLRAKAHLPHLHTWVPMIFDLSRTIQWWREAACLGARYGTRRAQLEEIGLTTLFVATLAVWANDESVSQTTTRDFLERRLAQGDRLMRFLPGGHRPMS